MGRPACKEFKLVRNSGNAHFNGQDKLNRYDGSLETDWSVFVLMASLLFTGKSCEFGTAAIVKLLMRWSAGEFICSVATLKVSKLSGFST